MVPLRPVGNRSLQERSASVKYVFIAMATVGSLLVIRSFYNEWRFKRAASRCIRNGWIKKV